MTSHQPPPRSVLRKAPVAPSGGAAAAAAQAGKGQAQGASPGVELSQNTAAAPCCLLDPASWQVTPTPVSELLTLNADFTVTGALGPQGLGKSAFLNRLLALGSGGTAAAAAAGRCPPFPVAPHAGEEAGGQHCSRGIELRASADRQLALDSQPLFSASVLDDIASGSCWAEQPPAALAAPAAAAASDAKAAALPFEGLHMLAQLQLAVLLLNTCHRLLVFCDGLADRRVWEFLVAAEMLCRGVPDPSLPPREAPPPAPGRPAGAAAQPQARQAPPQEHLAEVVLVHVLPPGARLPSEAQLQQLEAQLGAYFAGSRLCRPGALRMLHHLPGGSGSSGGGGCAGNAGGSSEAAISYWVLPALPSGSAVTPGSSAEDAAWGALVAQLLARPCPPFARRCSEQQWLRGVAGDTWRAVRKSPDIATFYSRLARTQLKGAGGFGLAR